jgi:hypothetical protein
MLLQSKTAIITGAGAERGNGVVLDVNGGLFIH